MQRTPLLNPPLEAAVCQKMIAVVQDDLRAVENDILTVVLDREKYLQKMGRRQALCQALAALEDVYKREFDT
jgi:hypothetical protein